jgi:2-oxoglutarate ferredoxin oxidoreductase subunit beta
VKKSQEWGDRIPIGVFYQTTMPTYEEQIPALRKGSLVTQEIDPKRVETLFAEFM